MLDKFRTIDLTWDTANDDFYSDIEAVSSDENGRKLVVQVLNKGQVEDLTGASLLLYWNTKDKHFKGFDNFEAVDSSKGIFELYFSTGMLSNLGRLTAKLHLVESTTKATTSKEFTINVYEGIDSESVESTNSFTALTEALSRVVTIETDEQARQDNEATRQQQESNRVDAESQRESTFDDKLIDWNSEYEQAESNRDSEYEQAEIARDDSYQTAEQVRDDEYAPRLQDLEAKTPGSHEWGIESGENENGSWVKLPEGTIVMSANIELTAGAYGRVNWEFPKELEGPPSYVNMETTANNGSSLDTFVSAPRSITDGKRAQFTFVRTASSSGGAGESLEEGRTETFACFAFGRWK